MTIRDYASLCRLHLAVIIYISQTSSETARLVRLDVFRFSFSPRDIYTQTMRRSDSRPIITRARTSGLPGSRRIWHIKATDLFHPLRRSLHSLVVKYTCNARHTHTISALINRCFNDILCGGRIHKNISLHTYAHVSPIFFLFACAQSKWTVQLIMQTERHIRFLNITVKYDRWMWARWRPLMHLRGGIFFFFFLQSFTL